MPEESNLDAVNLFRQIKVETEIDDISAAILTLAQSLSWININLQVADTGYPERIGKDIADAIEGISRGGAVQVILDGEMTNNVRAQVDASVEMGRSGESAAT